MGSRKGPAVQDDDLKSVVAWVEDELETFTSDAADNTQTYQVAISYSEPTRPRTGLVAYADGTRWNPGQGEGPYYRNSAGLWLPMKQGREVLFAARTYYVRSDGNNTNTGLVDSAAGAFLTIQKAIDIVASIDTSIYAVTIQVRSGTFTGFLVGAPFVGSGVVTVRGDPTTPANCKITDNAGCIKGINSASFTVSGFQLKGTGNGITVDTKAFINFNNIAFDNLGTAVQALFGATAIAGGGCSFIGTAFSVGAYGIGGLIDFESQNIVFANTPNFASGFCFSIFAAQVYFNGTTWNGGASAGLATGKRYNVTDLGIIFTGAAGVNFLPGSLAGTGTNPGVAPYGWYT